MTAPRPIVPGLHLATGWAAVLTLALLPAARIAEAKSSTQITIDQGEIAGTVHGNVTSYLGIPYAAPPVGPNRWRSPLPPSGWQGVKAAVIPGASCAQGVGQPYGAYTKEFLVSGPVDEDCLFLNVWTPGAAQAKRPVLVWIHGGGFTSGSSSMPLTDGTALAAKGIVVVGINYRLGAFGYLAHPALSAEDPHHSSGTYGLQDQVAALKWIQRNIARFGGDPANVTVMGESAGAISTNALMLSPLAGGLFQKAFVISGSGMGFPAPSLRDAERTGVKFAASLGAGDLTALRAVPTDKVLAATPWEPTKALEPLKFSFWPVNDGWALPGDPDVGSSRPFSPVPMMTGFNAGENFMVSGETVADFAKVARGWFGAYGDRILALYPHTTDAEAAASLRLMARDRYMTSLLLWTSARTGIGRQTIYQYVYDHPQPATNGRGFGSFHTAGLPYIFGNLDTSLHPYGPDDRRVSDQVQARLLAFMRAGDPNVAGSPAWPTARRALVQVMALGLQPGLRPAVSSPARLAAMRAFVADGGRLSLF